MLNRWLIFTRLLEHTSHFKSAFSFVAHDHIIYYVDAKGGLKPVPACRLRRVYRHLTHSIKELFHLLHCSCHPSALKLFTGFANAAFIA